MAIYKIYFINRDNLKFKNGIYFYSFVISVLPEVILEIKKKEFGFMKTIN